MHYSRSPKLCGEKSPPNRLGSMQVRNKALKDRSVDSVQLNSESRNSSRLISLPYYRKTASVSLKTPKLIFFSFSEVERTVHDTYKFLRSN